MAINFPNNPAVNDTFTVGGTTFTFTGVKWETSAVVELSSDITPTLGGDLDAGTHNINNVGVITATTFSGNLTGNVTGTATNAQGLTGDPSIQVTNATVLGNLDVQGTTTTIDTAITEVDSLNVEGSVGIGTTNPNRLLQVDGASGGNGQVLISTNGAFSGTDTADLSFRVYANPSNGNAHNPQAQIQAVGTGSYDAALTFKTAAGGSDNNTPLERLRITSGGQVQIPVNATGATSGRLQLGASQQLSIFQDSANAYIANDDLIISNGAINETLARFKNGGAVELHHDNSKKFETTSSGVTVTGTISDSIGSLRDVPLNDQSSNASYTLTASDAGKVVHAHSTTATVVVPNSVFSVGNVVTILNGGTGNIAINQGSGLTLRNNGDGSTGNRTLAQFGMATIYFTGASVCYISGSNMT